MKNKIGIGITTYSRPNILDINLSHLEKSLNTKEYEYTIVINDDNAKADSKEIINIISKYKLPNIIYIGNFSNAKGVTISKNNCLKYIKECDYIFLFDDDCFPIKKDWDTKFIEIAESYYINHLMYLREHKHGILKKIQTYDNKLTEFQACLGCCLFFTNQAIKIIGGFDPRMDFYGYEHAQMSIRTKIAGLQGKYGQYCSFEDIESYIYSFDVDYKEGKKLGLDLNFKSSLDVVGIKEETKNNSINKNSKLMQNISIYCPL